MITRLTIRNFKRFDEVEIPLDNPVVFVGPNNSGKTSAIQALILWQVGLQHWIAKYGGKSAPEKRPGVTVNRRDLLAIPHPNAKHLWRDMRVRQVEYPDGKQQTRNVRIEIIVEGRHGGNTWTCGLEFDFANAESFYCRPLRLESGRSPNRMPVPKEAGSVQIAYLPPMSGLSPNEARLDPGAVNVRIGEGRTAEVLRNLCFRVWQENPDHWNKIAARISHLFGADLKVPAYVPGRGEINLAYRERGIEFDISSSGRGLQQTLLILTYLQAHPHSLVLLDEPDAHLEILRQKQIYNLIAEFSRISGGQVVAASHSEVLLNEAAEKDTVIAFIGRPHKILNGRSQVSMALKSIGWEHFYQAEQTGWVLYLEGPTDLDILQAFARRVGHNRATQALERPFVHHVSNQPNKAAEHFHGLQEALPGLKGIALFDQLQGNLPNYRSFEHLTWRCREIENYFCTEATLIAFAQAPETAVGPLFADSVRLERTEAMQNAIAKVSTALETLGQGELWGSQTRASLDVLGPVMKAFFKNLGLRNTMGKRNLHELVRFVPDHEIDPEITQKLDAIASVAEAAEAA